MATLREYERGLVTHLIEVLGGVDGAQIYGLTDLDRYTERVPTVIFGIEGHTPDAIAEHLGQNGIYVWSGHYYAIEVMDALGQAENGLVRVGLAHYNTHDEIDRLAAVLDEL